MTASSPEPSLDTQATLRQDADVEFVDGEIVSMTTTVSDVPFVDASARGTIEAVRPSTAVVAARTAAVVTTGFVAGAIATAVVARKAGVVRRRKGTTALPSVVRSQRFLVDVHLLGDR